MVNAGLTVCDVCIYLQLCVDWLPVTHHGGGEPGSGGPGPAERGGGRGGNRPDHHPGHTGAGVCHGGILPDQQLAAHQRLERTMHETERQIKCVKLKMNFNRR